MYFAAGRWVHADDGERTIIARCETGLNDEDDKAMAQRIARLLNAEEIQLRNDWAVEPRLAGSGWHVVGAGAPPHWWYRDTPATAIIEADRWLREQGK